MKKYGSRRENIRFSIAAKMVVLAAFLILLWEDNEAELYAYVEKYEYVLESSPDLFSEDLGGSTEHWYSEGWPEVVALFNK